MLWVVRHKSCPMCHSKLTKMEQLLHVNFKNIKPTSELHPALSMVIFLFFFYLVFLLFFFFKLFIEL